MVKNDFKKFSLFCYVVIFPIVMVTFYRVAISYVAMPTIKATTHLAG